MWPSWKVHLQFGLSPFSYINTNVCVCVARSRNCVQLEYLEKRLSQVFTQWHHMHSLYHICHSFLKYAISSSDVCVRVREWNTRVFGHTHMSHSYLYSNLTQVSSVNAALSLLPGKVCCKTKSQVTRKLMASHKLQACNITKAQKLLASRNRPGIKWYDM